MIDRHKFDFVEVRRFPQLFRQLQHVRFVTRDQVITGKQQVFPFAGGGHVAGGLHKSQRSSPEAVAEEFEAFAVPCVDIRTRSLEDLWGQNTNACTKQLNVGDILRHSVCPDHANGVHCRGTAESQMQMWRINDMRLPCRTGAHFNHRSDRMHVDALRRKLFILADRPRHNIDPLIFIPAMILEPLQFSIRQREDQI